MRIALAALLMLGCRAQVAPTSLASAPVTAPEPAPRPAPPSNDELCRADGWDFAYDLPEAAAQGVVECGYGPGTPCDGLRALRCDGRKLLACKWKRTTAADCRDLCQYGGNSPNDLYDDGTCAERNGEPTCVCCSAGEPGCTTEPSPGRRAMTTPIDMNPLPTAR